MTPLADLVAYERGELDARAEARLEEHLFACAACARALEELAALGAGIAALVRAGRAAASTTGELLGRAEREGLRLRTYRIAPGEEVPCTAAPDDDYVALRLAAPGLGGARVDVTREGVEAATGAPRTWVLEDVLVDRAGEEVVLLIPAATVHPLPRSRWRFDLQARGAGAPRRLGPYRLAHTPWEELPPARRR